VLELHNLGQKNWCTYVLDILTDVNFKNLWDSQSITDREILNVKEKLYADYSNQCMTSINDSDLFPKLRTYKTFKTDFQLEPYLSFPCNPHHTVALVRFRISSHNLCIETGRYTRPKTPEENRLCIYCVGNKVENEVHFLIDCPNYKDDRLKLMQAISPFIPNLADLNSNEKFVRILSSKIPEILKPLGKFIFKSIEKRASFQSPGRDMVGASSVSGSL
jgi:hypothetical protein